jgi:F420-dependent methylenetetrahydromethanopterin dehydrogenase
MQYERVKGCCTGRCTSRKTSAVEAAHEEAKKAAALRVEEAELKRARIANGAEPGYKNGEPYSPE